MRRVATGLLVAMAGLFLVARFNAGGHPAWGYVQAFAEAAMVGGLADWFAVTALFRHPLGLPIPHTAIVPRNKDRIGDTLAVFLKDNFLIPRVVAQRMRGIDIAGAAGRWLTEGNATAAGGRMRYGAARLAANILESLDQERLGGMVRGALSGQLRRLDVAPLLGQALEAAIADGRHGPLMDGTIRRAARILESNQHLIRAMVHERAGAVLRWTGLDETLANKIIDGLEKLVHAMADDPDHPLRAKAEEGLAQLAHDLQHDPATQAKVARFKDEMLDNPALGNWWQGVWETMRAGLLRMARDPDAMMAGRLGEALRQLGTTLQSDPVLAATINRFARRAVVGAASDYGDAIVRLVSDTVRGWDAATITGRLENAVGRDLQYIRINGTLVGGIVGLAIHAIDGWL
ncbi:DUF445 domain-containing protein [Sphingomonas qomolangmaensis]|uniref:DUF445 domain-containing protein n=2 Tax=Sphingomonas qomolangmaensis TaxID=2918765 RepID=A0ABY5LCY2_9SPHN|nr:DUF445 domain-containing protein [Sphingomonas qomolangmaensis]UUL84277.1 DUF445 domain-containing protein [Sphingomonas qomolangmaensis]